MKRFALCFCALALAGCSMFHGGGSEAAATPACPATGLVKGAAFFPIVEGNKPHQASADLLASGTVQSLGGGCKYRKGEVVLDLERCERPIDAASKRLMCVLMTRITVRLWIRRTSVLRRLFLALLVCGIYPSLQRRSRHHP